MPKPRRRIIDAAEYGILRLSNSNKTILILQRPIMALFVLLQPVEGHHAGPKAEANQLMPAADRQYRDFIRAKKLAEGVAYCRIVVVEIARGTAQPASIRRNLTGWNRSRVRWRH